MANTKFQIKRTTVSGRTPNTTNASNTAYIDAGELAINLTDSKLFSSNGTASFEIGSNLTSLAVGTIVANGTSGTSGQVLTSNGTITYWANVAEAANPPAYGTVTVSNSAGTNTNLIANTSNNQLTFIGESGVSIFGNASSFEVTIAVQAGLEGLSVDYGSIDEDVFAYYDYGSLS